METVKNRGCNFLKDLRKVVIGIGDNKFKVETDGTWVNEGNGTTWDEISNAFVGQNIYTSFGRVDYNYDDLTLDFGATARYPEEPVGIVTQIPHARKADSDIRPHIHWMQTSAAMPNILIAYRMYNNGAVPGSWELKALTASDNAYAYTSSGMQQLTSFNLPEGHGEGLEVSFTFDLKIYRDSANASGLFSGADAYSGSLSLKYFDIHVERDMNGSREEFVK